MTFEFTALEAAICYEALKRMQSEPSLVDLPALMDHFASVQDAANASPEGVCKVTYTPANLALLGQPIAG